MSITTRCCIGRRGYSCYLHCGIDNKRLILHSRPQSHVWTTPVCKILSGGLNAKNSSMKRISLEDTQRTNILRDKPQLADHVGRSTIDKPTWSPGKAPAASDPRGYRLHTEATPTRARHCWSKCAPFAVARFRCLLRLLSPELKGDASMQEAARVCVGSKFVAHTRSVLDSMRKECPPIPARCSTFTNKRQQREHSAVYLSYCCKALVK